MSEPIALTELEEQLRADASGARKKELEDSLYAALADLRREMDAGLPPDEYQKMSTFKEGLEAAVKTLDTSWTAFHA
jgi:type III secretion system YseE family protein